MSRSIMTTGIAGVAAGGLTAGLLLAGGAATASESPGSGPTSAPASAPASGGPAVAALPPTDRVIGAPPAQTDPIALGIIVKTTPGAASLRSIAGKLGVAATPAESIAPRVRVLDFAEPMSGDAAQVIADRIADQSGVVWAEPNLRIARIASTPVFPTDPEWPDQWDMWDSERTDGGYSVRAPGGWGVTRGSADVVVAVIDTGITPHPDLDANLVPGYDFISDPLMANDGDGWDPDPLDNGDWITEEESQSGFFAGCRPSNSTWHGTHVSGTVAAVQDNGYGISGIAPLVRIQTIRTLGKCGGTLSDIAAGIRWAAGQPIPGVPDNPSPAQVINMSLGGGAACPASYQEAIDVAIEAGASVVVAAGNSSMPLRLATPANCDGVISVGATDRGGLLAPYSNFGTPDAPLTISAPGGAGDWLTLSTVNTGLRSPEAPGFDAYPGTSMATPHVAGAAALLYSQGVTDPAVVKTRLTSATQPLQYRCEVDVCGAGILDLNRLFNGGPAVSPESIGLPAPARVRLRMRTDDRRVLVTWVPPQVPGLPVADYVLQYSLDAGRSWLPLFYVGAPVRAIEIPVAPNVRFVLRVAAVTPDGAVGAWSRKTSEAFFPLKVPRRIGRVKISAQDDGFTALARFRWRKPAGEVDGYAYQLREVGTPWSDTWYYDDRPRAEFALLDIGRDYQFRVVAYNQAGAGRVRTVTFTTASSGR